jgi:replicative DNA helicase
VSTQLSLIHFQDYPAALFNLEAEAGFLGALMANNGFVDQAAERVGVLDLYSELHQRIYQAILSEVSCGRHATPPLLRNHFVGDEEYEQAGGFGYLGDITGDRAAVLGFWSFVQQIADLAKRRRLLDAMRTLQGSVAAITDNPVEALVDEIDNALTEALQRTETTRSMTIARAFDHTLQQIEDEAAGLGPQGIRIEGLDDFNHLTGDLRRGELMILGGRPSMGKTALALSATLGAARAGFGTLFISLEMRVEELMARAITDLIFEHGNSPSFSDVRRGKFGAFDRQRISETRTQLENWPLVITDPPTLSAGRLAMMIRRYQRQMAGRGQQLDLVVIDYLGLIRPAGKNKNRYEDMGEISRTLKRVAKECNVALLVLAQLNRECEKREDKRPQLSDLRDAGDIEQDADVVMFVYREEYYLERSEPEATDKKRTEWENAMGAARDRVELILAKARQGKIGKRLCYFFGAHQAVRGSTYFKDLHRE